MKYIILFLLLILSSLVVANEVETVKITTLEYCNDLTVKVMSSDREQIDNIELKDCIPRSKYIWKCKCNGKYNLNILSNKANSIYQFTLQYYVKQPETQSVLKYSDSQYQNYLHTLKRTKHIKDIQIGKPKDKFDFFKMLEGDGTNNGNELSFVLIIAGVIIFIIFCIVFFFGYKFIKSEFDKED